MAKKLIDLRGEIDEFAIIVRDLSTSPSQTDITSKQKIRKDVAGHNTINQLDRINIYGLLHLTANYTFFSRGHEIFA